MTSALLVDSLAGSCEQTCGVLLKPDFDEFTELTSRYNCKKSSNARLPAKERKGVDFLISEILDEMSSSISPGNYESRKG